MPKKKIEKIELVSGSVTLPPVIAEMPVDKRTRGGKLRSEYMELLQYLDNFAQRAGSDITHVLPAA